MVEMKAYKNDDTVNKTAVADIIPGQVVQLDDGRAGYNPGVNTRDAGDEAAFAVEGVVTVAKTTGIVLLHGGDVFWDVSANKAHFKPAAGTEDFCIGTAYGDAASADTTMHVQLNEFGRYIMNLTTGGEWTSEATNGLGVTLLPGGGAMLSFDAVAEAAQAALYSNHSVPIAARPIFEARVAVFDKGDDVALDIDIGLASGSHATDFETVANFAVVHLDGNSLNINVMSDDGTTDVAAADSTIDAVDDTYFEIWIDCRDPDDVKVYVDGVLAVPDGTTLALTDASNGLKPIVMIEKTSNDTVADVRVSRMRVRTSGEGQ